MHPARNIFRIAVWSALLFGFLEGAALLLLMPWESPFSQLAQVGVNVHILWAAPLFDVGLFAALAAALALVYRPFVRFARQPSSAPTLAFGLFSFVSFLGLLLLPARLDRWAAAVLALGLTTALCRWIRTREAAALVFVRRTLPYLAGVWLLVAVGIPLAENVMEVAVARALPPAGDRPNVLLIVMDTVRADHLSVYGYARPTSPHLEKLANEGVLFTRAVAPSSWTLPLHASLFTGLYSYQHGAGKERLDEKPRTLAEELAAHGYLTAGFAGNTLMCHRWTGLARGFLHYEDFFVLGEEIAYRSVYGRRIRPRVAWQFGRYDAHVRRPAGDVTRGVLAWLDSVPARPFFAFVNYFDAHEPYLPPAEFAAKFSSSPERIIKRKPVGFGQYVRGKVTPAQMQAELDAYDAALAYVDEQIGVLLAELERRGRLENTLVVVTSDHGESLFEHGVFGHGLTLYRPEVSVPLILRFPKKIPAGLQETRPAGLTDIAATILDLTGVHADFPGRPLTPLTSAAQGQAARAQAAPATHEPVLSELEPNLWEAHLLSRKASWLKSLTTSRWHFIRYASGEVELFDWKEDPAESRNLAGQAEFQPVVAELTIRLETLSGYRAAARPEDSRPHE